MGSSATRGSCGALGNSFSLKATVRAAMRGANARAGHDPASRRCWDAPTVDWRTSGAKPEFGPARIGTMGARWGAGSRVLPANRQILDVGALDTRAAMGVAVLARRHSAQADHALFGRCRSGCEG